MWRCNSFTDVVLQAAPSAGSTCRASCSRPPAAGLAVLHALCHLRALTALRDDTQMKYYDCNMDVRIQQYTRSSLTRRCRGMGWREMLGDRPETKQLTIYGQYPGDTEIVFEHTTPLPCGETFITPRDQLDSRPAASESQTVPPLVEASTSDGRATLVGEPRHGGDLTHQCPASTHMYTPYTARAALPTPKDRVHKLLMVIVLPMHETRQVGRTQASNPSRRAKQANEMKAIICWRMGDHTGMLQRSWQELGVTRERRCWAGRGKVERGRTRSGQCSQLVRFTVVTARRREDKKDVNDDDSEEARRQNEEASGRGSAGEGEDSWRGGQASRGGRRWSSAAR